MGARLGATTVARGPHAALQLIVDNERCARARLSSVAMHRKARAVVMHKMTRFTVSPGATGFWLVMSACWPARTASSVPTANDSLLHGQRKKYLSSYQKP